MAAGDFTKDEVDHCVEALNAIMETCIKTKRSPAMKHAGDFNDIFLFLDSARKRAVCETEPKTESSPPSASS